MIRIFYELSTLENLSRKKHDKIVLVSPLALAKKLAWATRELKQMFPNLTVIRIPDGEPAKEWDTLKNLLSEFQKARLTKKSLVFAMGGGTTTDLTGFACSMFHRGIPYANIPTTLVGQVDASFGGKTAINFGDVKNTLGAFYNPLFVIIEARFLETLGHSAIVDGLAEIIKAGLIKNPHLLHMLQLGGASGFVGWPTVQEVIKRAIKVKEYFVARDPFDEGIRQALNFGHTLGHAFELKHKISHGMAVLIGMQEELKLGEKLGKTDPEIRKRLNALLGDLGITIGHVPSVDSISMLQDKKIQGDKITLPVITDIGKTKLIKISLDKILSIVEK